MNPRLETCSAVEEAIPLYVGGDLMSERRVTVDQHLRACGACRAFADRALASRSALLEGLRTTSQPEVDLWVAVRAGLVQDGILAPREPSAVRDPSLRPDGRPNRAWRYLPLGGLAAAAALGALWLPLAPTSDVSPALVQAPMVLVPAPEFIAVTPVSDKLRRLAPSDEVWDDRAYDLGVAQAPRGPGTWNSYRNPKLGSPAGLFSPGKTR